uniref:Uncharacterized protein n=1 Tax=uncultured marine virus TaxID=186617 RepID=A0A0F7L805_9VIRU|nr:hypothetical protein [uncultured marine virus]
MTPRAILLRRCSIPSDRSDSRPHRPAGSSHQRASCGETTYHQRARVPCLARSSARVDGTGVRCTRWMRSG